MRSYLRVGTTVISALSLVIGSAHAQPIIGFGGLLRAGRPAFPRPTGATLGPGVTRPSGASFGPGVTRPTGASFGPGVTRPVGASPGLGVTRPTGATLGPGVERPSGASPGPNVTRPTGATLGPGVERPSGVTFGPGVTRPSGATLGPGVERPSGATFGPGVTRPTGASLGPGVERPTGFPPVPFDSVDLLTGQRVVIVVPGAGATQRGPIIGGTFTGGIVGTPYSWLFGYDWLGAWRLFDQPDYRARRFATRRPVRRWSPPANRSWTVSGQASAGPRWSVLRGDRDWAVSGRAGYGPDWSALRE